MGCDWDAACGYSTARMVRIRDRRLGIMVCGCKMQLAVICAYQVLLCVNSTTPQCF